MSTRRLLKLCIALSAAGLAACSLLVDVELPNEGDDSRCDFLNDEPRGDVTPCVRWQFNDGSNACELVPLDRDDDGFFPAVCVDDPVANITDDDVDCDDTAATGGSTFPRATEACDGADNDCDGRIDEGALVPSLSDSPTVAFSAPPTDVSYAVDPLAVNSIGVAYTLSSAGTPPGVNVRDRDFSSENAERLRVFTAEAANTVATAVNDAAIVSQAIDLAPLGGNQYALAFVNPSGGRRRIVAGVATQANLKTLFTEASVFGDGLPCSAEDGDCEMARPAVDSPTIGVSGSDVLVASVRRTTRAEEACQVTDTIEEVRVVGNALRKRDFSNVTLGAGGARINAFPALRPTVENPSGIELGMVRADATIAAVGVPGGFIVALPQADRTLLLRTVTVTAGVYEVDDARDVVLSIDADSQPLLDPTFAISTAIDHDNDPETPAQVRLALAFRRGCAGDGTAQVQLYNVDAESGALSRVGNPRRVDGDGLASATSESRPSITFAPEQNNTWFVAYAKQRSLRGRVLAFDGTPHAAAATTLIDSASRVGAAPGVFATPTGSFGGANYGATVDATIDDVSGVYTVHLGCFDSD